MSTYDHELHRKGKDSYTKRIIYIRKSTFRLTQISMMPPTGHPDGWKFRIEAAAQILVRSLFDSEPIIWMACRHWITMSTNH